MNVPRRKFLRLAAGAAALPAVSRTASAQVYPSRPVRIIVGFTAGGAVDIVARLIGQWLSERLGAQFVIENRPGGGGNIGPEAAVRAAPDGYTFLVAGFTNTVNTSLYDQLRFDFIRDLAPVAAIAREPNVLVVNPSLPIKTLAEFIAYAKANPGKLNMASAGNGSPAHVAGELFKMMTGVDMIHVPYRGGPPALTDLVGGQVEVMFVAMSPSIEYIRTGKLRALAVTTAVRSEVLPQIPTVDSFLPGYDVSLWNGLFAPRQTPVAIVDKLNKEINAGLADPQMRARLAAMGNLPISGSPAQLGKLVVEETEKWAKVVKFAGIKAE
jgi:tripartite-type tricarboxylate transporter receptor subunit TctC